MRTLTRILAATLCMPLAALATPASAARNVPAKEICGDYLGVVRCIVATRPAPKAPRTDKGMKATASPTTVRVDGTVTVTAGKAPGGTGYRKGELVRLYEFWKGKVTELTGTKFAGSSGSITFKREFLSLVGVDTEGPRTLCARGERSGRMACVSFTVGTSGSSDTTTTPKTAAGAPAKARTTTGMKGSGSRKNASVGQSVKVTHGAKPGSKGFRKGETVVYYDYSNGTAVEVGRGKAGASGRVTWTWTHDGTLQGTHKLCSYGRTSKKMACYTVVADGTTTTTSGTPSSTVAPPVATVAPTTTKAPTTTVVTTTIPSYSPPVAG